MRDDEGLGASPAHWCIAPRTLSPSRREVLGLRMEPQTTIHAVGGSSPLLRMMFFATGLHGNTRVEHITTVRTVSNRDRRTPMI